MKNSILFLCVVLLAMNTVMARNTNPVNKKNPKTITEQVTDLLAAPQFTVTEEVFANVTLIVNKENEVVVLDVDSTDENVTAYIKSRLNYKKLNAGTTGQQMILPVRILPAE